MWFAGVEGGFDYQEIEYEETHNIVILPEYVSLPFPSVELPEKVWILLLDSISKIFIVCSKDHLTFFYLLITL